MTGKGTYECLDARAGLQRLVGQIRHHLDLVRIGHDGNVLLVAALGRRGNAALETQHESFASVHLSLSLGSARRRCGPQPFTYGRKASCSTLRRRSSVRGQQIPRQCQTST